MKGADFPVAGQKLIYAGKILEDETAISEYSIDEKKFVVVMVSKPKVTSAPAPAAEASTPAKETSAPVPAAAKEEKSEPPAAAAPTASVTRLVNNFSIYFCVTSCSVM